MRRPIRCVAFVLLTALFAGCAHLGPDTKAAGAKSASDRAKAPGLSSQRLMLSQGYSMLYVDAGHLDLAELILYVKAESESTNKMVTAISDYGGQLKRQLERLAKDYPGVRIDLDPLPDIEKRKRSAIAKARARYFAPVVGHGGREYERTVLIGFANGINHQRYLCQVMAELEPDANLKKFLVDTQQHYDDLYERVNTLLEKEYFKDPNGKSKD